jgi:hypothetical protein
MFFPIPMCIHHPSIYLSIHPSIHPSNTRVRTVANSKSELGVVVHICNPSIRQAEAGRSQVCFCFCFFNYYLLILSFFNFWWHWGGTGWPVCLLGRCSTTWATLAAADHKFKASRRYIMRQRQRKQQQNPTINFDSKSCLCFPLAAWLWANTLTTWGV